MVILFDQAENDKTSQLSFMGCFKGIRYPVELFLIMGSFVSQKGGERLRVCDHRLDFIKAQKIAPDRDH